VVAASCLLACPCARSIALLWCAFLPVLHDLMVQCFVMAVCFSPLLGLGSVCFGALFFNKKSLFFLFFVYCIWVFLDPLFYWCKDTTNIFITVWFLFFLGEESCFYFSHTLLLEGGMEGEED
jgi:hypothetical protein